MRSLLILCMLFMGTSMIRPRQATDNENQLNGTWLTIKLEMNGTDLPAESFQNQKLIIEDSNYTFIAESVDKGVVKVDGNKIDIYGRDGVNAGNHFTAIYKFENEHLVISYNLKGDSYPEDYETKDKPMHFVAVFKKEGAN